MRTRRRVWGMAGGAALLAALSYFAGTGLARNIVSGAVTGAAGGDEQATAPTVIVPSAPAAPAAPGVVQARGRPAKPQPPVTAAKAPKPKAGPSVLAQEPGERPPLSPPLMLGPTPKPSEGPAVTTAPAQPAPPPPPGPPVAAAPAAPEAPGAPMIAGPSAVRPDEPATLLPNGFTERPSQKETPEIHIVNMTGRPATLTLAKGETRFRWQIDRDVRYSVPPGEYVFRLYHAIYERSGRPDMVGTITCRRYRTYECEIFWRDGSDTRYGKLGDKD